MKLNYLKKYRVLLLTFLVMLSCVFKISAQEVTAFAILDTNKIRIGEQTKIDLYVSYNVKKNLIVKWPAISDTLRKQIDVINVSKIDTTIPDKNSPENIQQHQTITITSFDSGYWAIEPFVFIVNDDTANAILTSAFLLEVQTLPVDTAEASIRDIKAPFDEPTDWREYLPYVYWGLAILAAIILLWWYLKKMKKHVPPPVTIKKPTEAPHIIALRNLEAVRDENIWRGEHNKEFYTRISDIIRVYIEGRFGIYAMELTSEEIIKIFRFQVIDVISKEKLKQILVLADLVKFAKMQPILPENEMILNHSFDFVNGTKREVIVEETKEENNHV